MTKKNLFMLFMALTVCIASGYAQKRRTKAKTKKTAVVVAEKTPEEKLFEELLPSTAKVMFIDSIVVDKTSFLSHIPISSEMGTITRQGNKVSYTNEFGNTRIVAAGDTITGRHLYMTHCYDNRWTEPQEIKELPHPMADFPFLMPDGITLYFSAEGDGTIGGRDIFRTTYDADGAHFYEATNLGMPYNSPANEYLLAISDMDNIGFLVSDRYQQEDKVCIYIFEPTSQRKIFDEDTDTEILKRYAALEQIKDTWSFGNRQAALQRRDALLSRLANIKSPDKIKFIVNDDVTYTSLSDFQSSDNRKLFQDIMSKMSKLAQLNSILDDKRNSYTDATRSKKHEIGRLIIKLEEEILSLEEEITTNEKTLRNLENK